jgi:hypothetical protein
LSRTIQSHSFFQLKKLLNKVVHELGTLGLSPAVLQELLQTADSKSATVGNGQENGGPPSADTQVQPGGTPFPKVVYEFSGTSDRISPQLRLWVKDTGHSNALQHRFDSTLSDRVQESDLSDQLEVSSTGSGQNTSSSLLWTLQRRSSPPSPTEENLGLELEEEQLSLGVTNETR